MCCSEGVFAGVPGMNIVSEDRPVFPCGLVLIDCRCEVAPLDAFTRLGRSLLVIDFVECPVLDHVFPDRGCQERAGAVPLIGYPEQAELIQRWLDQAEHVWIFLKDDGEQSLRSGFAMGVGIKKRVIVIKRELFRVIVAVID